ncbi:unnamed protein product [Gongylonema pulchrum]|uniref:Ovule protein n=1 Tax=Gongylonema pulchrum TaxID=637853 RepID=A0A183DKD1_9BILA|nr:unnamed protein product [Gongylonema pulchrum]
MSNVGLDFNQKKMDWEQLVKNIFITEGLSKVLPLLQKLPSGASSVVASLLVCFFPVLVTLRTFTLSQ